MWGDESLSCFFFINNNDSLSIITSNLAQTSMENMFLFMIRVLLSLFFKVIYFNLINKFICGTSLAKIQLEYKPWKLP